MTLSASTKPVAAPQRGGDRALQHQVNAMQAGRQQDSRGTIDRRDEVATYSQPTPDSCAAAAHPTTGVRRARELSPSLRSQNRPHAQLVEGYATHPDAAEWPTVRHDPTAIAWHSASPACHGHTLPVSQEDAQ